MHFIDLMNKNIKNKLKRKTYVSGSTIIFAEEENDYIYFLIDGIAEASIVNPQGTFATLHLYKSGSFFGELEQFYDGKKPVEITAITECIVDALHRDDFLEWLHNDFTATKFLIKELSYKLITNAELVEELLLLTVKERLLRSISIHHYKNSLNKLTKEQLSKEVNAPIRSINRALAECKAEGTLCYEHKKFLILNEDMILKYFPQY